MRCHQVLTGACNASTDCFAVGTVLGMPFTVYATGCDLAILDERFERTQILTAVGDEVGSRDHSCGHQVSCVDCSADYGRIAAGCGRTICVFDPVPVAPPGGNDGNDKVQLVGDCTAQLARDSPLKVRWHLSDTVLPGFLVRSVAWNLEGTRLLAGGEFLQLWVRSSGQSGRVEFALGDDGHHQTDQAADTDPATLPRVSSPQRYVFQRCWQVRTAEPVHFMAFSRDGSLFATAAERDNVVKVWFSTKPVLADSSEPAAPTTNSDDWQFDFIYLAHPSAVSGLQWRRTSKFMHQGDVANMLVTSCRDNICRVWAETLASETSEDVSPTGDKHLRATAALRRSAAATPGGRNKNRLFNRLKHIGHYFHMPWHQKGMSGDTRSSQKPTTLTSESGMTTCARNQQRPIHFHLAVTINAEFDIPLVPSMVTSDNGVGNSFMVHWLNNKELTYNAGMEHLLRDMDHHEQQQQQQQQGKDSDSVSAGGGVCSDLSPIYSSASAVSSTHTDGGAASAPPPSSSSSSSAHFVHQLEKRLSRLNTDWESGSDLIFSIHPVDGSFLVWTIDFLDERTPCHRQAQVSFCSRIPQALPLGDAMTMSTRLCLFAASPHRNNPAYTQLEQQQDITSPSMSMVSKHSNGSLNLWTIIFNNSEEQNSNESSSHSNSSWSAVTSSSTSHRRFNSVMSVTHERRVCGHRFGVNSVICHPVLPLMLSTSHHTPTAKRPAANITTHSAPADSLSTDHRLYASELILWRVDPVGPLSRQGGLTELTRINVPDATAFSHVAWIPALLPSTTLGPICNSPSACYIASDGRNLNVYQAVIDARSMLAEINMATRKINRSNSVMSVSSDNSSVHVQLKTQCSVQEAFRIVSQQSAARPGCVIHLDTIPDVTHDGEQIQFLHVYQERLIAGSCGGGGGSGGTTSATTTTTTGAAAHSDQCQSSAVGGARGDLLEPFYVVLVERDTLGTMIHTWRLVFSANPVTGGEETPGQDRSPLHRPITVVTSKVCTQRLCLPEGVEVVSAEPAAGHLSAASLYPVCSTPYHIVSVCSDQRIRFWKCSVQTSRFPGQTAAQVQYNWTQWMMHSSSGSDSSLQVLGRPLSVSVAYSGRVACAFQKGEPFSRKRHNVSGLHVNVAVTIHQCESTGGSEWIAEDTIDLANVPLYSNKIPPGGASDNPLTGRLVHIDWVSMEDGTHLLTVGIINKVMMFTRVSSDISLANMKALKERQQTSRPLLQKSSSIALPSFKPDQIRWMKVRQVDLHSADGMPPLPLQMTWVRDGVLIVGLQNEMHVYSQWKMPPLQLSRDRQYHVPESTIEYAESRNLTDQQLFSCVSDSMKKRIMSVTSVANLELLRTRPTSTTLSASMAIGAPPHPSTSSASPQQPAEYMPYYGLFEAARIACPVLPQYHPKQLMELLNCGKVKRVKAILAHVVRYVRNLSRLSAETTCIPTDFSNDDIQESNEIRARSRRMSVSIQPGSPLDRQPTQDVRLDYEEVDMVPPLALWMLLAADRSKLEHMTSGQPNRSETYDDLFKVEQYEATLEDIVGSGQPRRRMRSMTPAEDTPIGQFGPKESCELTQLLTHCHLPDLTSIDQLYLMALADTIASLDTNPADISASTEQDPLTDITQNQPPQSSGLDSVDECGLRYVLAMKNFIYLSKCLPPKERSQLVCQGLTSSYVVWGFHSESSEELLQLVPSVGRGQPLWSELQQLGVGWWLRNGQQLRRLVEQLAKTAYQKRRDPMDAALFYIAMKKRSVVAALFKQQRDTRKHQFFSRDFSKPENKIAAKKNAYQCLGKQSFESAAALFLLADSLDDCIGVILSKLKDLQLAMVVCRLFDTSGDSCPASLQQLLNREVLGIGESGEFSLTDVHPDPFLRSMAYWILQDYSSSLQTLLQPQAGSLHPMFCDDNEEQAYYGSSPSVFNFYVYLRTHPMILMQRRSQRLNVDRRKQSVALTSDDLNADLSITASERQMYFSTAHTHYMAGCPTLTLEVLSKLPANAVTDGSNPDMTASPVEPAVQNNSVLSGTVDWSEPVSSTNFAVPLLSAGQATRGAETPLATSPVPQSLGQEYDWSTPVRSRVAPEPLQLSWDDDERQHSESSSDSSGEHGVSADILAIGHSATSASSAAHQQSAAADAAGSRVDVMTQQLKFAACLQLMTEQLACVAMDNGCWREQLYCWLEKEVLAVGEICQCGSHSGTGSHIVGSSLSNTAEWGSGFLRGESVDATDVESKLMYIERKRAWLKENQALLRTLLSYCSLQGTAGGSLASVRMELILLLQELQQETGGQQLLSRLPFNTSIPLLSASVASNKTVVMDPVRHVHTVVHDLLYVICQQTIAPSPDNIDDSALALLKNTAVALSCCVYQSLCDNSIVSQSTVFDTSVLNAVSPPLARQPTVTDHHHHHHQQQQQQQPLPQAITSTPSMWPGVTSLRALLARERDEDAPNLTVLLSEVFVSVYVSLLMTALACCDSRLLYRMVRLKVDTKLWSLVFGGGLKKFYRSSSSFIPSTASIAETAGDSGLLGSLNIQRMRLNMKLLGQFAPGSPGGASGQNSSTQGGRESPTPYREIFLPPQMSLVQLLLAKPSEDHALTGFDDVKVYEYDSDTDSVDDPSEYESTGGLDMPQNVEHSDHNSYSWQLLRFSCIKLCRLNIISLLTVAGIDIQELALVSPLIHSLMNVLDGWVLQLETVLNATRPPANFVTALDVDETAKPPIVKYRAMMHSCNTPFLSDSVTVRPVKRLWLTLVRQEPVQDMFIRALFSSRSTCLAPGLAPSGVRSGEMAEPEAPIKILHKDQDAITAFCVNQANTNQMVLATHKDLQELDISLLVNAPDWLETESDFDSLHLKKDCDSLPSSQYLVVQTSGEGGASALPGPGASTAGSAASSALASPTHHSGRPHPVLKGLNFAGSHNPYFCRVVIARSRHLLRPISRHKVEGVRRLCSHPTVSVYLTGGQDGSVAVREWNIDSPVSIARESGTYAKVNRVAFNHYGNKFGVADNDGNISLWQLSQVAFNSRPFYSHQSHNKMCADFAFVECSSLLATCGLSTDSANVCVLDTLLPKRKCQVTAFTCHETGASTLLYSPVHQVLLSGGKKGDVCVWDLRQRQLLYKLLAHENSAIRSMSLDSSEQFLVTGNEEGDLKLFDLTSLSRDPVVTYRSEHSRVGFFKNLGHGVTQLEVDPAGRLFSCGADGSMKLRSLPLKKYSVSVY